MFNSVTFSFLIMNLQDKHLQCKHLQCYMHLFIYDEKDDLETVRHFSCSTHPAVTEADTKTLQYTSDGFKKSISRFE